MNPNQLHEAARMGNKEEVRRLLHTKKFSVNDADDAGQTPLMVAAYNPEPEAVEVLKYLISKKASVDAVDSAGWTGIHLNLHLLVVDYKLDG